MMAGIDMVHVPYKGSPPVLTDLLAGQIAVAFDNVLIGRNIVPFFATSVDSNGTLPIIQHASAMTAVANDKGEGRKCARRSIDGSS